MRRLTNGRPPITALAVSLLLACGPNPPPPVRIMALVPDETGTLASREVELNTVDNVVSLKGATINFIGTSRVVVSGTDPLQQNLPALTPEERYQVIVKDRGADVRGHYIERGDVLWPADFHTWNMVSAYYNFERAQSYFNGLYDRANEYLPLNVHYWSDVRLNSAEALKDNALYLSFINSFVLVPFETQQRSPLAMNLGVVTHETAHRVFNYKVLRNQGLPTPILQWNNFPQAFNFLKSLDEGLADFHGFGATCYDPAGCRPNFLAESIDDERFTNMRNLARTDACMSDELKAQLEGATQAAWTSSTRMYEVGNLVAAALYQAGNTAGPIEVLQRALIAAYDDESPSNRGLRQLIESAEANPAIFTPEAVTNVIAGHIQENRLRQHVCSQLAARLRLRCASSPCIGLDGVTDELPKCDQAPITVNCP